jgi:hypothetical protein
MNALCNKPFSLVFIFLNTSVIAVIMEWPQYGGKIALKLVGGKSILQSATSKYWKLCLHAYNIEQSC